MASVRTNPIQMIAVPLGLAFLLATSLCSIALGQIPDGFDADPKKAEMMVIVAHPDDESTFGGLLPYYATCCGKSIIFVSLTSGEWGNGLPHHSNADQTPDYSYDDSDYPRFPKIPIDALYPCYYREGELARMLTTVGVRYKPIMPRFQDMSGLQPWGSPDPAFELWGGQDQVVGFLVKQIRRFRPDVIVTMAKNGYNGNPQHMAASRGAVLACQAASDPKRFAENAEKQTPWQTQKLYLVVSDDESHADTHLHHWELDCDGHPGNARILAARGNAMHESQEMKEQCPETTMFILEQSTVGPDVIAKDNLFENLR